MAFSHSFSSEFYGDVYEAGPCERPENLADAIASMPADDWASMARDVFGIEPEFLTVELVYERAIETDTVSDFGSPVSVWIDSEGFYTVDVY